MNTQKDKPQAVKWLRSNEGNHFKILNRLVSEISHHILLSEIRLEFSYIIYFYCTHLYGKHQNIFPYDFLFLCLRKNTETKDVDSKQNFLWWCWKQGGVFSKRKHRYFLNKTTKLALLFGCRYILFFYKLQETEVLFLKLYEVLEFLALMVRVLWK